MPRAAADRVAEEAVVGEDTTTRLTVTHAEKLAKALAKFGQTPATYIVPSIFIRSKQDGAPGENTYEKLEYGPTQTVKDFRDQSKMNAAPGTFLAADLPKADTHMPQLFATGMANKFPPLDALLKPPKPAKVPGQPAPPKLRPLYAPEPQLELDNPFIIRSTALVGLESRDL